ncbi:MAG TPA: hypothetical protein PLJ38_10515, partial [bacterium]|nr:hypothetical protein [bacterium]
MGCKKIFEDRNIFSDKLEIEIFDELLTELGIMLKCGKTVVLAFINFVKLTNQDYNIIYKERYSAAGIMPVQFAIQDDYSKQKNEYLAEIIKMQLKPFLIFNHQTFEITILVESISADFPASILAMNAA